MKLKSNMWLGGLLILITASAIYFWLKKANSASKDIVVRKITMVFFNTNQAKKDLENGTIRCIASGGMPPINITKWDSTTRKYGYHDSIVYYNPLDSNIVKGIQQYNATVEEYLNNKNGKDWRLRFNHDVDSIIDLENYLYNVGNH